MIHGHSVGVVIPAFNEELLIEKTIRSLPAEIDIAVAVNDGSTDNTEVILTRLASEIPRLHVLTNRKNGGIGYSLKRGFDEIIKTTEADYIGIVAGDAQCDPRYIETMLNILDSSALDYVKANRFHHRDALKSMPRHRLIGNVVISLLIKLSTGYYSVADSTNSFGFFRRSCLENVDLSLVGDRYDYEATMLGALSLIGAHIKEVAVPAIYGEETSTIPLLPTVWKSLKTVVIGLTRRIYYKYILYSLHPIAIFLLGGLILLLGGLAAALSLVGYRMAGGASPSSGTVIFTVLPILLGFQMLLTAFVMDVNAESN